MPRLIAAARRAWCWCAVPIWTLACTIAVILFLALGTLFAIDGETTGGSIMYAVAIGIGWAWLDGLAKHGRCGTRRGS